MYSGKTITAQKENLVTTIDPQARLGDLVAEDSRRAELFERLGLDYCCGGQRSLADACGERGLDIGTVTTVLAAVEATPDRTSGHVVPDATIGELCDHIITVHHGPLRSDMQRITDLLATVVRVHGADHAELADMQERFAGVRGDLEHHMLEEEQVIFPACLAVEGDPAAGLDEELIAGNEQEHAGVGEALVALRERADGYDTEKAYCGTHRALLGALDAFERDLHQHIHEENNVLFPRVRRLAAAA
jgi:regulator of cell morphogenesis and NO signaling